MEEQDGNEEQVEKGGEWRLKDQRLPRSAAAPYISI